MSLSKYVKKSNLLCFSFSNPPPYLPSKLAKPARIDQNDGAQQLVFAAQNSPSTSKALPLLRAGIRSWVCQVSA